MIQYLNIIALQSLKPVDIRRGYTIINKLLGRNSKNQLPNLINDSVSVDISYRIIILDIITFDYLFYAILSI